MFKFTNYLVKYIQSIDPNFDDTGIDEAFYSTKRAFINTNKPEAAFQIERILQGKNVGDMFPGDFFN